MLQNADHLLGLINDILDLSKIEAGRMDLLYEATELLPLVESVMTTAMGLTREKGLALRQDIPDELPIMVIDRVRIRQVMLNILCPYLAHHHPAFWPNPEHFDPDRFSGNLRNPEHFHPFGAGRRQCIAKEYVLMEGPLILATIAKKYAMRLKYSVPVEPLSSTTLVPKQQGRAGIMMTVHPR